MNELFYKEYRKSGKAYPKPHPAAEWQSGFWLVPVGRCEHGNIDPHEHYVNPGRRVAFCPGSPTLNKGEDE